MAAAWTLVPAPTLRSARRSCAVAFSSEVARNESVLDLARCHSRYWSLWCQNKELTVDWFPCGWDADSCSRSMAIMVGWYHCGNLREKNNKSITIQYAHSFVYSYRIKTCSSKLNLLVKITRNLVSIRCRTLSSVWSVIEKCACKPLNVVENWFKLESWTKTKAQYLSTSHL